jgi:hypothetical protein
VKQDQLSEWIPAADAGDLLTRVLQAQGFVYGIEVINLPSCEDPGLEILECEEGFEGKEGLAICLEFIDEMVSTHGAENIRFEISFRS